MRAGVVKESFMKEGVTKLNYKKVRIEVKRDAMLECAFM